MSVLKNEHNHNRVGKGDARHDNFKAFQSGYPKNLRVNHITTGVVTHRKTNRTRTTYK